MSFYTILPYLISVAILFVILKLASTPVKVIIKFIINSILGGIAIYFLNFYGSDYGIDIGLNIFTSIFVGFTGLPGVLTLILITKYIL